MSISADNSLNYFSPVELCCRASQEKVYAPNFLVLVRTAKNILWKYWGVFLKEEKIWSADVILFTLLWFTNWPRLISLWNCFLSAKWIELATAFLLIQSNKWNTYWGLAANLSSQHFSLACTYFEGVNGISLSSLKWFLPLE